MRGVIVTTALVATLLGAGIAHGELVHQGGLRLAFSGSFSPHALPRDRPAPVTVSLRGSVKTADGARPPQLRRLSIAVNRYGKVSTAGLPTCSTGQLETTPSNVALERCGDALVGKGSFGANVDFPDLLFPVRGKMLAFNGRANGRPVILLHIHGSNPVEATVVLTFKITHPRRGDFGTVLSAKIPKIAADLGYVTDISLSFDRRYSYKGERRSFISAQCAAPDGFPGALFVFARGSFSFANGQTLATSLVRDCLVR